VEFVLLTLIVIGIAYLAGVEATDAAATMPLDSNFRASVSVEEKGSAGLHLGPFRFDFCMSWGYFRYDIRDSA
jgi:hypothetical protein